MEVGGTGCYNWLDRPVTVGRTGSFEGWKLAICRISIQRQVFQNRSSKIEENRCKIEKVAQHVGMNSKCRFGALGRIGSLECQQLVGQILGQLLLLGRPSLTVIGNPTPDATVNRRTGTDSAR